MAGVVNEDIEFHCHNDSQTGTEGVVDLGHELIY